MDLKKKKITALVCVLLVILLAVVGVVTGVVINNNNKKNVNPTPPPIVNYSSYTQAITEGYISQNYKGAYKLSGISSVEFNFKKADATDAQNEYRLSQTDVNSLYANKGVKPYDKNGFMGKLFEDKQTEVAKTKESIVFNSTESLGLFTRNHNLSPIETGSYAGDDDVIMITLDNKKTIFASFKYSSIFFDDNDTLVLNGEKEIDYTKLYITENIYSNKNSKLLLFTVTYIYELQTYETLIPDSELDF